MRLEDQFDFSPSPHEKINLKGTRIGLEHVVRFFKGGMSAEQIAHAFAYPLPLAQVYAAITYYLAESEQVDAYVARLDEEGERHRREIEGDPRNASLRAKLRAAKAAKAPSP